MLRMSTSESASRRWLALSASVMALAMAQGAAFAQEAVEQPAEEQLAEEAPAEDKVTVSDKKAVTPSSTASLVNLLVEQGVITQEQADSVISQVDDETYVTRQAVQDATSKADEAAKAAAAAASAASPPGSKRVSYVPEVVKRQLREDIRKEVMTQAREEGWASPGSYPEWAGRIRFHGDLRGRYEGQFYPDGGYNAQSEQFNDFNAINTGSPYDINGPSGDFPSLFNTAQARERYRIRARLGMEADLSEGFSAGLRIATGSDASPVSTNQTLGGNFSKYQIWLDRGYLKYEFEPTLAPFDHYAIPTRVEISAGRFDNPFWAPTDLAWDSDLGFDGAALKGRSELRPGFTAFAAGGLFPIFNTSLDFASHEPDKFKSADKYMYGGQVGLNWQATQNVALTFGAGVYEFSGVQGKLSSPCDINGLVTACDTDHLRPSFAQKGNTYMYLRDNMGDPDWTPGDDYPPSPQYYGLASAFRPVVLSGRVDFGNFHPVHVVVDGEFVWNSAFDRQEIDAVDVNNKAPNSGAFDGGDIGWMTRVTVGHQRLERFGDWNANIGYRYLESDAVMDAFTDSDFGLGGTNLQGYFLGGNLALSKSVWATAKWMSASSIAGEPYAVDVLQIDLNAKF